MSNHAYMAKFRNKVLKKDLPGHPGKKLHFLAGKAVELHDRSIWLLSAEGEEPDYSLWIVQPENEDIYMWPYEGTDYNDLIKELGELYIETAFDEGGVRKV